MIAFIREAIDLFCAHPFLCTFMGYGFGKLFLPTLNFILMLIIHFFPADDDDNKKY